MQTAAIPYFKQLPQQAAEKAQLRRMLVTVVPAAVVMMILLQTLQREREIHQALPLHKEITVVPLVVPTVTQAAAEAVPVP
jgi:chromate transport protein ChrA